MNERNVRGPDDILSNINITSDEPQTRLESPGRII